MDGSRAFISHHVYRDQRHRSHHHRSSKKKHSVSKKGISPQAALSDGKYHAMGGKNCSIIQLEK